MMRFIILPLVVIILGVCIANCTTPAQQESLIADSTLVKVLIDLHLIEVRISEGHDVDPGLRDSVFSVFGIDSLQFAATMRYFSEKPDAYASLYSRIIERLNTERSPIDGFLNQPNPDENQ